MKIYNILNGIEITEINSRIIEYLYLYDVLCIRLLSYLNQDRLTILKLIINY